MWSTLPLCWRRSTFRAPFPTAAWIPLVSRGVNWNCHPPPLPPAPCQAHILFHSARKINVAKFRARKVNLMLVTDVAARGIDIPLLDYVINYDFPAKPKLFVHRVGRVARAGRSGDAYSLVSPDEVRCWCDGKWRLAMLGSFWAGPSFF